MSRNDLFHRSLFSGLIFSCLTSVVQAQTMGSSGVDKQEIRAQLRPARHTTLSAEIGAVVQRIWVQEGERFEIDTPLIQLDCGLHEAQRAKSTAELAGAQRSLQANQRLAELNAAGLMELDLAKSAVERSQAELRISETQLSKCEIKAPFAGIVAEQRIREQQYVHPARPGFVWRGIDCCQSSARTGPRLRRQTPWRACAHHGCGFSGHVAHGLHRHQRSLENP